MTAQAPKILIVDDEPEDASTLVEALYSFGYSFIVEKNCSKTYELTIKEIPDIILLKWELPVMDGLEALKKLKGDRITAGIPVIIVTENNTSMNNLHLALDSGANEVLRKPVDKDELTLKVKSMLLLSGFYKNTLDLKNAELSSFAAQMIHLSEFNDTLIQKISEALNELKFNRESAENMLTLILSQLKSHSKVVEWDSFNQHFLSLNPGFVKNISTAHPDLTPAEIRLCTLLKLNLSTKEIARFLHQTPEGIRVSRTRLRKKIKLPEEQSLSSYFMKF